MKYRLEYISTFHAEMPPIADYLAEYPRKAARIFAKIDKMLTSLEDMPELCPVYRYASAYRFFTVEDYLVLYKVKHQDSVVEVHHLFNGRMDILARLKD
ncbi:MAG: type II toxin-antitoxin system RelE/ParE family toxin [Clostridiales bacterium]|jgi:plasmid stabilization system protein ParE|nr:type II toxin-antitoxin system RelE/ParE family toxin [Clostridiales bacterium]